MRAASDRAQKGGGYKGGKVGLDHVSHCLHRTRAMHHTTLGQYTLYCILHAFCVLPRISLALDYRKIKESVGNDGTLSDGQKNLAIPKVKKTIIQQQRMMAEGGRGVPGLKNTQRDVRVRTRGGALRWV